MKWKANDCNYQSDRLFRQLNIKNSNGNGKTLVALLEEPLVQVDLALRIEADGNDNDDA